MVNTFDLLSLEIFLKDYSFSQSSIQHITKLKSIDQFSSILELQSKTIIMTSNRAQLLGTGSRIENEPQKCLILKKYEKWARGSKKED